jgi:hypothetical protein
LRPSTPDSPWTSLWDQLTNAQWVANTGIPTLATVGAIVASFLLLRFQIQAERKRRLATDRAMHGRAFGHAVLEAIAEHDSAPGGDAYWTTEDWSGWHQVYSASQKAEVFFGEQAWIEDAISVARTVDWVWKACQAAQSDSEISSVSKANRELALDSVVYPWLNILRKHGTAIVRWDGESPIPSVDTGHLTYVPLPRHKRRAENTAWMSSYRSKFVKKALEIHRRNAVRRSLRP